MKKKPKQKAGSERGRLLVRARRRQGLTRRALAEKIGVTKAAIHAWENAQRVPSEPYIPTLAAALGISADALLDILEKP